MKVITPEFRVAFPNVFEPQLNKLSGKQEYSVVALFKKGEDLRALKAAALAAAEKKWPKGVPAGIRSPFREQGEKSEKFGGFEEGAVYITVKSKDKPQVVDQNVNPILDKAEFYAGCWAKASIVAFAYDQLGNRGVSFGLNNIQKTRDGDPLGNRSRAVDDFAPLEDSSDGSTIKVADTGGPSALFD